MRSLLLLSVAVAAILAACGSSATPSWTYAPPTQAPASQPAASGDASAPPASEGPASQAPASQAPASEAPASQAPASQAPASEAPASQAPASQAPASEAPASDAPSSGTGDAVALEAASINWVEKELAAPADTPFVIQFTNNDQSVPHDVVIKDGTGAEAFRSDVVTGVATVDLQVPALTAGAYQYLCSIHPSMTGTLTVGG